MLFRKEDMSDGKRRAGDYFREINATLKKAYDVADKARKKGYDPELHVDIPIAKDMAERVEGLISSVAPHIVGKGLPKRIKELEEKYGFMDWRVALRIAEEVSKEKFCKFKDIKERMEVGIRVGFLYNTLGIVSAPLEGFIGLDIKKRNDGKEYVAIRYAGPIRAAGATAASVSVLISDYIRKVNGFDRYDPDEREVNRFIREVHDYHERITNLQYHPSDEEIGFLVRHIPVEISGDPTDRIEVSNFKDLPRVGTNQIRGGMCLVIAEGLSQKCSKLWKRLGDWGESMGLDWGWVEDFIALQKRIKAKKSLGNPEKGGGNMHKLTPNYTFITDIVAGRPVYTYPMEPHGFRLRYGRARNTGFSAAAVHPYTMYCLSNFVALGTQFRIERPGKSASILSCDSIEPPIVKLKSGDVVKIHKKMSEEDIRKTASKIEEILFLGDILFNYGDFSENGHMLVPAGYCPEWWALELEKAMIGMFGSIDIEKASAHLNIDKDDLGNILKNPLAFYPDVSMAEKISRGLSVPIHPDHIFYWKLLDMEDALSLLVEVKKAKIVEEDGDISKVIISRSDRIKGILEKAGISHRSPSDDFLVMEKETAKAFLLNFGILDKDKERLIGKKEKVIEMATEDGGLVDNALDVMNIIQGLVIKDKAGTFIGARMGRPEKAKMRKLKGSPHTLFPIGDDGGRMRCFQDALKKGTVSAQFPIRYCQKCKSETIYDNCEACGSKTVQMRYCPECRDIVGKEGCKEHGMSNIKAFRYKDIDIKKHFASALEILGMDEGPDMVKGVKGTNNKDHIPEHLAKGILRAEHDIYVNKDGTIRYDFSEEPLTHFKPKEIGTGIEKLRELGYGYDIYGKELLNEDQVLEIFPQDIVISRGSTLEESCCQIMLRVSRFVDDLLVKLYKQEPYYNMKTEKDVIGALVIGLAPHISAGMIGRIIGFTEAQAGMASPLWHAALRRDCDGDEACVILLMDALLNFSRQYLPDKRGGRTMDAPLVLTSVLNPAEVDDQALGLDIVSKYPLELYETAERYGWPNDVKVMQIADKVGTDNEFFGYGFTHGTDNINTGVKVSAYKTLPSMKEKLEKQMEIACKIRAVDASDVARLIIEKHFLRDTKGNLRKFSMQSFRCARCNEIFRRPPLIGRCDKCGGSIMFTVSEGSVIKYFKYSLELAEKYGLSPYMKQSLDILKRRIEGVFGKDADEQESLGKFIEE